MDDAARMLPTTAGPSAPAARRALDGIVGRLVALIAAGTLAIVYGAVGTHRQVLAAAGDQAVPVALGQRDVDPAPYPLAGFATAALIPGPNVVAVNSTGDASDATPGDDICDTGGTNSGGAAECTLRAAMQEAGASALVDGVMFAMPDTEPGYVAGGAGSSHWRIQPSGGLPSIGAAVTIDATTQTTFATGQGYDINDLGPEVELDGTLASGSKGFAITGSGSEIRGLVIGGFSVGVEMSGVGATGNTVAGNYIGTDATGGAPNANGRGLRFLDNAGGNTIGGSGPDDGNVISGNSGRGIDLEQSDDNTIQGNHVGVDAAGTSALPNGSDGISFINGSVSNTIGGSAPGAGNVIGGNGGDGIRIADSTDITIAGNAIGTDHTGLFDLGNGGHGVRVTANGGDILIGGLAAADGNRIANNGGDGVYLVDGVTDVGVLGNSFHANTGLGIDLAGAAEDASGVTANDSGDGDTGPNHLLNTPVIDSAVETGGTVNVGYTLDVPTGEYWVEFFVNPSGADPSGHGEGETVVARRWVDTGADPGPYLASFIGESGMVLTATTTVDLGGGSIGSTSEFAAATTVVLDPACSIDSDGDGLWDCEEDAGADTDGDGFANHLDDDDDGDGTPTASEHADPNGDGDPRDAFDSDADGQPDYLDVEFGPSYTPIASERKVSDIAGGLVAPLDIDDRFGHATAAIGDLDGDGIPELAVGAPGDDDGGTDRGAVHILFLNADGTFRAERKISETVGGLAATLADGAAFGSSVAGVGDVDGDGVADLAVGAPGADAVHLLFLQADGTVRTERTLPAATVGDDFGAHVAGIGDVDGDGVADLAVGAPGADDGGTDRGAVHILFLRADGTVRAEQKISDTVGGLAAGLADSAGFGAAARIGDLDGDGVVDLAVGAPGEATVHVVFLNTDGTVAAEQAITAAADAGSEFGASLTSIGDADGDGITDLIVGAPGDDDGGPGRGAASILFLDTDGTVRAVRKISDRHGGLVAVLDDDDRLGSGVASLGDLDGDGALDIVVGAPGDDDGGESNGAMYVLGLAAAPTVVVVNSTADGVDASPGDGSCETATAGECTLRAALEEHNALATVGVIEFAIPQSDPGYDPGTGTFTIAPTGLLPMISDTVVIDGSTQPEAGALPAIVVDGTAVGTLTDGGLHFVAGSDWSEVRGLTMHSFPGLALEIEASDNHLLTGLVLGLAADGVTPAGNRFGIYADDAHELTIGGERPADRNVISANEWGVALYDGSDHAVIVGNYVGTDHTGLLDRGNDHTGLFVVNGSSYARVGGPDVATRNVVAGNGQDGIYVGSGTMVEPLVVGNLVGVAADGATPLPNDRDGISLGWGNDGRVIDNLIGPHGRHGLHLEYHDRAVVQGNFVGTDPTQTRSWRLDGWAMYASTSVDDATVGGVGVGEANVFAHGTLGGIALAADAGIDNALVSNTNSRHAGPAIDLGADGVTQNDAGDGDAGPNDLLNRPVLHRPVAAGATVSIDIVLDVPAGDYRVEIFDAADEAPFGGGGGHGLVHAFDVTHTGSGMEWFAASFGGSAGDHYVATVTERGAAAGEYGSTSESSYRTTAVTSQTLVVNSTDDDTDITPGDGLCHTGQASALGTPECTLRAAIAEAGAAGIFDAIHFEVPDVDGGFVTVDGSWTIAPATEPLPALTTPGLDLDARTQPTWSGDPVIELDGSSPVFGPADDGVDVDADGVLVRGLSITNWPDAGTYTMRDDVVLQQNWFGVDPAGTPAANLRADVIVAGTATDVHVGGATPGAGNVFAAGSSGGGIWVTNSAAGTLIGDNSFGLAADGVTALGAVGEAITVALDAAGTVIADNTFAHLPNAAIALQNSTTGTSVTGNSFGLDGNLDPAPVGIALWADTMGATTFGGTTAGSGNTVAHTPGAAVANSNLAGTLTVLGNSIADGGPTLIDVGWDGRTLNDSPDADGIVNHPELVSARDAGGRVTADFTLDVPGGNYRIEFFAGEGETFVHAETITHGGGGAETFTATFAGATGDVLVATATEDLAGTHAATSEFSEPFTVVVETVATVNSTADDGDADPGNGACETATSGECTLRAAIDEANASADVDTIEFDIPVDDPGYASGVWTIGPAAPLPATTAAVAIDVTTQAGWAPNTVAAPQGLDGSLVVVLDGSAAGVGAAGLDLRAPTEVRGLVVGDFDGDGIAVGAGGDGSAVVGSIVLSNAGAGVRLGAGSSVVGGVAPPDRNQISGNGVGIHVGGAGSDTNRIEGNLVGTDATGTAALPNIGSGIEIESGADGTIVGGSPATANVVSGNGDAGISLSDAASPGLGVGGTIIRSNLIGVAADGTSPLGNAGHGVVAADVAGTVVGGPDIGDGNTIAHNVGDGVAVDHVLGDDIAILGNSIWSNGGLGIDLLPSGVNANDPGDIDGGANDRLNHPVIRAAHEVADGRVLVDLELDVAPGTNRIELFANPAGADPSGSGEGERLVGAIEVGHVGGSRGYTVEVEAVAGDVLSATATEVWGGGAYGSTSEFSPVRTVTNGSVTVLDRSLRRSDVVSAGGLGATLGGTGGLVGDGAHFAGGTERLLGPPTEIDAGALTLSSWVNATTLGSDATLISKRRVVAAGVGDAVYELVVDGTTGEAVARIDAGAPIEARGGSIDVGGWHQVAATWDGAVLRVHVDGVEVGSAAAVGTLGSDVAAPVVIGNTADSAAGVDGQIDQIEIARVARSADWIATSYNNLNAPKAMVSIGAEQTSTAGSWAASTAVPRSGSHALSAPSAAGADAWAVAAGIDEPGIVFESWWYLTDPTATVAAAGTNTGAVATDQREVAAGAAGLSLGSIDGAAVTVDVTSPTTVATGTWTRVEIRTDELGRSSVWLDGVEIIPSTAHTGGQTGGSVGLRSGQLPATERWYVDDVRIRRYLSDEPTTTLGPIDRR